MATLVQNAIRIKQAFDNTLSAIRGQGYEPTDADDVSTYSAAIDLIPKISTSGQLTKTLSSNYYSCAQKVGGYNTYSKEYTFDYETDAMIEVYASCTYNTSTTSYSGPNISVQRKPVGGSYTSLSACSSPTINFGSSTTQSYSLRFYNVHCYSGDMIKIQVHPQSGYSNVKLVTIYGSYKIVGEE